MRLACRHLVAVLIATAITSLAAHACSNSILRNAAEAGLETVPDTPRPTPTVGV